MCENNELSRGIFQDTSCGNTSSNKCKKNDCTKEKGIKVYVDSCDDKGTCCFCDDPTFILGAATSIISFVVGEEGRVVFDNNTTQFSNFKYLGFGQYRVQECGWYHITTTLSAGLEIIVASTFTVQPYVQKNCNGTVGDTQLVAGAGASLTGPLALSATATGVGCVYLDKGDVIYVNQTASGTLPVDLGIGFAATFNAVKVC